MLGRKFAGFKRKDDCGTYSARVNSGEQEFNGSNDQQIASIQLKKGKYLLTMSFLVKTVLCGNESFMYIYLNGREFIQYEGFYSPAPYQFLPRTIEKMYEVVNDGESISISTNYCDSYPVTVRNFVLTAKRI